MILTMAAVVQPVCSWRIQLEIKICGMSSKMISHRDINFIVFIQEQQQQKSLESKKEFAQPGQHCLLISANTMIMRKTVLSTEKAKRGQTNSVRVPVSSPAILR